MWWARPTLQPSTSSWANFWDSTLAHAPTQEQGTRIKALQQPAISQFRLRVGEFRVYYDVDEDDQEVYVLRVREKGRRTTDEVTTPEDH